MTNRNRIYGQVTPIPLAPRDDDPAERERRIDALARRHALGLRLFEDGPAPADDEEPKPRRRIAGSPPPPEVPERITGEDLMTASQVAKLLHVHKRTLHRLVRAGTVPGPSYRLSRKSVFWSGPVIQAFLRWWIVPFEPEG